MDATGRRGESVVRFATGAFAVRRRLLLDETTMRIDTLLPALHYHGPLGDETVLARLVEITRYKRR
jgi:hypothetical protein